MSIKILVLDNYDSFTYNLVTLLRDYVSDLTIDVKRNDQITLDEVEQYDKILLSPGPSVPDQAGITKALIRKYASTKSILGICLGHQAIAEVFGAKIYNMPKVYHGYQGKLVVGETYDRMFDEVSTESPIGQYHSWSVSPEFIPEVLKVTATNKDGLIMGLSHTKFDVKGLQFHPESILTEKGGQYIENWLNTPKHHSPNTKHQIK